jgi:RNA polymerase sigma factor (sigma-70 family)
VAEEDFDLTTLEAGEPDEASRLAAVALRHALLRLNPDQQEAIRLAYFGGLTYEETAKRLRIPLGTLKSRIRAITNPSGMAFRASGNPGSDRAGGLNQ